MIQKATERIPSHTTCYLSRALLLASSFSFPKLNLPMTTVMVQGHLHPSTHSSNPWSLPSALPASQVHSFSAVSDPCGWDWSDSAVGDSLGMCPIRIVSFTMVCSLLSLVFFHYSFVICFIFRSRVKIKTDLPFLCFISPLGPSLFCTWSAWNLYLDQAIMVTYVTLNIWIVCSCTAVVLILHMRQ